MQEWPQVGIVGLQKIAACYNLARSGFSYDTIYTWDYTVPDGYFLKITHVRASLGKSGATSGSWITLSIIDSDGNSGEVYHAGGDLVDVTWTGEIWVAPGNTFRVSVYAYTGNRTFGVTGVLYG